MHIHVYFNNGLTAQVKIIFIQTKSVNLHDTMYGKLHFMPHVNAIYFGKNH